MKALAVWVMLGLSAGSAAAQEQEGVVVMDESLQGLHEQEQRALDKQRNILAVAGLMKQGMSADEVADIFKAHISPRLVDLASGELLDKDPAKYNQALALKDPQMSLTLEASQDPAGIKRRSNLAEIYLVRDPQKRIQEVVLPIYGNGLWSVMYAFVALELNLISLILWYELLKGSGIHSCAGSFGFSCLRAYVFLT